MTFCALLYIILYLVGVDSISNRNNKRVTGPLICYACTEVADPRQCNQTTWCSYPNEYCIVVETITSTFDVAYTFGCTIANNCFNVQANSFGKKRNLRHDCCKENLCNNPFIISAVRPNNTTVRQTTSTTIDPHRHLYCDRDNVSSHSSGHNRYAHFHKCKISWNKALDDCKYRGMKLSKGPKTSVINSIVRTENHYMGDIWVGGFYNQTIHSWQWLDGKTFSSSDANWAPREPDDYGTHGDSNCLALVDDNVWRTRQCDDKNVYVCE